MGERPVAGAAVEEDERALGDLLEPRAAAGHQPVGAMLDEDQRIVPEADRLHGRVVEGAGEPDLGVAAQDHLQDLLGVARAHRDHDVGPGALEAREHGGQQVRADRERRRDPERPARRRLELVHGLAGAGDRVDELLGVGTEGPPGRRELRAAAAPLEEGHAERGLQGLDPGAHGRLGDAERRRGPPEAAEGAHRQEGLDLVDLHAPGNSCRSRYVIDSIKTMRLPVITRRAHSGSRRSHRMPRRYDMSEHCRCGDVIQHVYESWTCSPLPPRLLPARARSATASGRRACTAGTPEPSAAEPRPGESVRRALRDEPCLHRGHLLAAHAHRERVGMKVKGWPEWLPHHESPSSSSPAWPA